MDDAAPKPAPMPAPEDRPILRDVDGREVGTIVEELPGHIEVEGRSGPLGLGRRSYTLSRDRVARTEGRDWYLSITREELERVIASSRASDVPIPTPGPPPAATVVRHAEDLEARQIPRQVGEIVIRKEVVEETRTIEVAVRREVVRIERRGVASSANLADRRASAGPDPATGPSVAADVVDPVLDDIWSDAEGLEVRADVVRIPVVHEELVIERVPRVVEEIVVFKNVARDTVVRSEPVRAEHVTVEEVRSDGTRVIRVSTAPRSHQERIADVLARGREDGRVDETIAELEGIRAEWRGLPGGDEVAAEIDGIVERLRRPVEVGDGPSG
jgi:stress response protein YsnF